MLVFFFNFLSNAKVLSKFSYCFFAVSAFAFKGAEATCVDIATQMKKCFRLKDMLHFNIP